MAASRDDVDGEILDLVRTIVGPDVPIGASLDLHANVSQRMASAADALNAYRTNPHVDARERGAQMAQLVISSARGEVKPTVGLAQIPAVISILRQATDDEPMRTQMSWVRQLDDDPRVLSASITQGFPYADVEDLGMCAIIVTNRDEVLAKELAHALASRVWSTRGEFVGSAVATPEAVAYAASASETPTLLLDVGDNIGGGAPENSLAIAEEARRQGLDGVLSIVQDPVAAATCHTVGVGSAVQLDVAAASRDVGSPRFRLAGIVRCLHDGLFEDSAATHAGQRHFDTGASAVVSYGANCLMVLTSRLEIPSSLMQLRCLDIAPETMRVIIAKGVQSPLAGYEDIAAAVIRVDTPGLTSADLSRLDYRRRRRPLHPFEPTTFPKEGQSEWPS